MYELNERMIFRESLWRKRYQSLYKINNELGIVTQGKDPEFTYGKHQKC